MKMAEKTVSSIDELRSKTAHMIALAGNPNVGKSTVFNNLTGLGVITANYAGKTVELNLGLTRIDGIPVGIVDLPGIYSMGSISEDQFIARQALLENYFDAVAVVLDSTNLARNLYMLLQLMDMEFPVIVALNLVDEMPARGLSIDIERLEKILGVKVVPTSAVRGTGIDELIRQAMNLKCSPDNCRRAYLYGADIEQEVTKISDILHKTDAQFPFPITHRACALLLIEKDAQFLQFLQDIPQKDEILAALEQSWKIISSSHGEESEMRVIRERHGLAGSVEAEVLVKKTTGERLDERLWRLSTNPLSGFPLLLAVGAGTMMILFAGGNSLSNALAILWSRWFSPPVSSFIGWIAGNTLWATVLRWGFDDGMLAAISVGIPYVLIFYLILSFLEDTGYLNAAAFLFDRTLHVIGLHGRAIMPLAAAIGCNVPAVIGTRILGTLRERIIAIFLIVLISCSARTAVIISAVSQFLGWFWAFVIIVIDLALVITTGMLMNRYVKGESEGLVMEVFPLRMPQLKTVVKKTWARFADFVWIATPIVIIGSMVLGYLYESQLIWKLSKPLSPIVEWWLGLPDFAGLTLIFAVLRKELALQFLVTLAAAHHGHSPDSLLSIMTREQIFTFTLFNTLYLPCIATIAVIKREIGPRWTFLIMFATLTITILLAGIIHHLLLFSHALG
jgi:ferrous iron transport protein B